MTTKISGPCIFVQNLVYSLSMKAGRTNSISLKYVLHGATSGVAKGGRPPPQSQKKHSLKKAKSVEKLGGGGVHVTSPKLKLIKYVATKENDDILEEHDL